MTDIMRVAVVVVAGCVLALVVTCVRAQTGPDVSAFFKSLTQPGGTASCCDLADCKLVDSEWRDGGWYALAVVKGWIAIPDGKIIRNKPNIMEKAILCTSPGDEIIYCYLPPDFGT